MDIKQAPNGGGCAKGDMAERVATRDTADRAKSFEKFNKLIFLI